MSWITESKDRVILNIHATPRASKSQVQGLHGDALKVRLQAPPVDGKANEALLEFLAKTLGIPQRQISLVSGQTNRQKRIAIHGLTAGIIERILRPCAPLPYKQGHAEVHSQPGIPARACRPGGHA